MLTLVSLLFATTMFASNSGWEKLGEVNADISLDRVTINCANKGFFKAIKVKAEGAPIDFESVLVRYATGAVDNLRFSQSLKPGEYSEPLDLRGNKRVIKEVILYLKSEGKESKRKGKGHAKGHTKKQGRVQIWGQK